MKHLFDFWRVGREKHRITFLAGLRTRPSRRERVLQRLRDLAGTARKEMGCVCLVVHRSRVDPDLFTTYQVWKGEDFLEAHAKTAHVHSFRAEAPQMLESPVLTTRWKIVE